VFRDGQDIDWKGAQFARRDRQKPIAAFGEAVHAIIKSGRRTS
jgi:hypothetical protein